MGKIARRYFSMNAFDVVLTIIGVLMGNLTALIVLIPFFLVGILPAITWAYDLSLGFALVTLFGLGLFLGHTSQENRLFYGVKTVIAISFLLGE